MPNIIEPKLQLISHYLKLNKKEKFVIPSYQRAYSWEKKKCEELWQDIADYINDFNTIDSEENEPYFFGTIITDCSDLAEKREYNLIDGQQRTTTFLLLLKALLLRLNLVIDSIGNDIESEGLKAGLVSYRSKVMSILYKADADEIPAMLRDPFKLKDIIIIQSNSINEIDNRRKETKNILEANSFDDAESIVVKYSFKHKDNKYTNYFRNFKFFYEELSKKK